MKVSQSEDLMVIRETPGCLWLFAGFFILISSVFVYGSLGGFSNYDQVPGWTLILCLIMGLVGLSVGIWQLAEAPVSRVTVDRRARTVTHFQLGLRGKIQTVYDFDQIKQFRTVETVDSDGDPIWYFGLEFFSGTVIRISSLASPSEKYKQDIVFEVNNFLGKHMPSYRSDSELNQ